MYKDLERTEKYACIDNKLIDRLPEDDEYIWLAVSKALLAQIYGAIVGHKAKVGIAWTQRGLKFILREDTSKPQFSV